MQTRMLIRHPRILSTVSTIQAARVDPAALLKAEYDPLEVMLTTFMT